MSKRKRQPQMRMPMPKPVFATDPGEIQCPVCGSHVMVRAILTKIDLSVQLGKRDQASTTVKMPSLQPRTVA